MFKKLLLPSVISATVFVQPVQACGPFFQPSYMEEIKPYNVYLHRYNTWTFFVESVDDLFKGTPIYRNGTDSETGEKQDFAAAVKKHFPKMPEAEQQKLVKQYLDFLKDFECGNKKAKDYPALPAELDEFRLYHAGWEELETRTKYPENWKKLIALSPERRHFRTTWVLYMLGNLDKANIHAHAATCRKAVDAGFADTLGVGWASYKQEIRYGSDPVKTIRAVIEAQRGTEENMVRFLIDYNPKFANYSDMFKHLSEAEYYQLLNDPVCREFMLIHDLHLSRFLPRSVDYKFRSIDILAYRAWELGKLKQAKEYLVKLEKPTLLSLFIEADMALYYGNITLAAEKLRQWLKMAEKIKTKSGLDQLRRSPCYEEDEDECLRWKNEIYGRLGHTMVMKRDFMNAARFFYESGQGEHDLPYIAERFLSLDQLMEFTDSIAADAEKKDNTKYSKPWMARQMIHLTARRAFREGKIEIAKKYMPDSYKVYLEQYLNFLAAGRNEKLGKNERAIALYNAAKIMRYRGMELCGTEDAPDFYVFDGDFAPGYVRGYQDCYLCKYDLVFGSWTFCPKHVQERTWNPGLRAVKNYLTVPLHQRFHYRYLAAELALEAGELAEDQELRALIHLFGGECLRRTSAREADIFYKRLVLRSRKTKLAKAADRACWFPNGPYSPILEKEICSVKPLKDLNQVKDLMKQAFAEPPKK